MNYAETHSQVFPNGRRRKREILMDKITGQKYEKYDGEVQEINNVPLDGAANLDSQYYDDFFEDEYVENGKTTQFEDYPKASAEDLADTSSSRWLMYDGLAKLLDSKKMQGRACVLRGICEAAEAKFSHHSGLFGELLHIIFT